MRFARFAAAALVAMAATFAAATPEPDSPRPLAAAEANLKKGDELVAQADRLKTNADKLQTLDRALYFLRRARTLSASDEQRFHAVHADAGRSLVRALDDQAEIYLWRKSLWLADKRVDEALAVDPNDSRSRRLDERITSAATTDVWSNDVGTVAGDRIRARRAALGVPLRDRGVGRRR